MSTLAWKVRRMQQMSGEEIAARTGHKLATVWVQLHRARGRFLEEMKRETGDPA